MIDRHQLLSDLQRLLAALEADLLERSESAEVPEVGQMLRADYERAREAARTAQSYEAWRSDYITQMAASWVLSCVFVRFLEDNRLIEPPKLAGPGDLLQRARDEHELYFRAHPKLTDREYLLSAFDRLAQLPGTRDVFGEHNPLCELPNWLSGDAAGELLKFFQKIDANSGALVHDFSDARWDTRFLGDLYQDLSEAARKKYALLQTPEFVEEFILDRTLEPALDEFGLDARPVLDRNGQPITDAGFRMIDPACGSGHFLLGSFRRILDRWHRQVPGTNSRELVQRTLDSIHGVDVNPYAIAIARFRLLLAAMQSCNVTRLSDAPAFIMHLACGDSLLHGAGEQLSFGWRDFDHATHAEDVVALRGILVPYSYHAVVANPPYIVPRDAALATAYRDRYGACYGQYQLVVPFIERCFGLTARGTQDGSFAGFLGLIVANAFTRAAFGATLVETYFPRWEVTHVVDTSGAYIPGHGNPDGTPTLIFFARNRVPLSSYIRQVISIKSEPAPPVDPRYGQVWLSIKRHIDDPGSHDEFTGLQLAFRRYAACAYSSSCSA